MGLRIAPFDHMTATQESERRETNRRHQDEWVQWLAMEANEVLSVIDRDGTVTYISPAAERLFGWDPAALRGEPVARLFDPEDLRGLGDPRRMRERRRHHRLRCLDASGAWRETVAQVRPVFRTDQREGGIDGVGMVIVMRDVTDELAVWRELRQRSAAVEAQRQELADRLRASDERPLQADRLKDEFLQTISHELRTPLTAILGFSDLLAARGLGQDHPEIDIIRRNGRRLLEMIDDLFVLARAEAGELELEVRPVDVTAVAQRVVEMMRPSASAKRLVLHLHAAKTAIAVADQFAVEAAPRHLVDNAVKFTDEGVVEVSLHSVDKLVRVEVRDSGPGVPAALRDAVFSSFTQADQAMTRRHGGSGIGLTLARRLLELQGGILGLDEHVDGGSVFWFELPGQGGSPGPLSLGQVRESAGFGD